MQNDALHIGHVHFCCNQTSSLYLFWRAANHLAIHSSHHIGRQWQVSQRAELGRSFPFASTSEHCFCNFVLGVALEQARHKSSSWSQRYFGFAVISSLNTSMNRSNTDRWIIKLTPDNTVIGRSMRSCSSLKSNEFTRIENSDVPFLVGFTMMLTNCTDSVESSLIKCVSLYCVMKILIVNEMVNAVF